MKVGEYIRTPYGIRKIVNIKKDDGYGKPRVKVIEIDNVLDTYYKYSYTFYTDEKVVKEAKHSFDIIDLIQEGDYVNGGKVFLITDGIDKHLRVADEKGNWGIKDIYEDSIKSIVTKECFESMEYKVKE